MNVLKQRGDVCRCSGSETERFLFLFLLLFKNVFPYLFIFIFIWKTQRKRSFIHCLQEPWLCQDSRTLFGFPCGRTQPLPRIHTGTSVELEADVRPESRYCDTAHSKAKGWLNHCTMCSPQSCFIHVGIFISLLCTSIPITLQIICKMKIKKKQQLFTSEFNTTGFL